MKPTHRKSRAGNLLMLLDLTFGPSFKVKRWFTDFGELSFRWIQICIGSPMRRSCFKIGFVYIHISHDLYLHVKHIIIIKLLKHISMHNISMKIKYLHY